jgi:anionic cell wall polymer biosynthesis LytR-Cps2A-Psr (LCP) family protein
MSTPGWLSEYVEKVSDFLVVLHMMSGTTPSAVSIPRDKGATSQRRRSCVFSDVSSERMAA